MAKFLLNSQNETIDLDAELTTDEEKVDADVSEEPKGSSHSEPSTERANFSNEPKNSSLHESTKEQSDTEAEISDNKPLSALKSKRKIIAVRPATKQKELKNSNELNDIIDDEVSNNKPTTAMKKSEPEKIKRVRWTTEQKSLTVKYFKKNIQSKKPPTETEIEKFRSENEIMTNKDWKKVKAFVFN